MIKYSFIIPVKAINDYIQESVPQILKINRDDFEIIVYPDEKTEQTWSKTRQISSGFGGPAIKRSLASRDAQGEILIFIDDDAYPAEDFLEKLDLNFNNSEVVAVGGPAMTPASDNFGQRVSGAVFLSKVSGGNPDRYIPIGKKRLVDDWPSVNLSVRKLIFDQVGGFNSEYWPGEDTLFCLELMKKTGKKIVYDPEVLVWHHRRAGFKKHLKQIGNYGLHRGHFVRKFPETSRKLLYFIPSLFLIGVVLGFFASIIISNITPYYIIFLCLYVLVIIKAFFDISNYESIQVSLSAIPYIVATHFVYGWRFILGLCKKELKSKLR